MEEPEDEAFEDEKNYNRRGGKDPEALLCKTR